MTAPLAGIKVLDITANMSGPFGTMILGDQGADVIKVEPPVGDPIRQLGTGSDGLSAYYANLNRSKRSVVLDLERPRSRARPSSDCSTGPTSSCTTTDPRPRSRWGSTRTRCARHGRSSST